MTLSHAFLVWVSGYVTVFCLGFQSRNAVAGHYVICACTSFTIAMCQVVAVHAVMDEPWLAGVLIGTSGAAGICTAIYVNLNVLKLGRVK